MKASLNVYGDNDFGGIGAIGREDIVGQLANILVGQDADDDLLRALAVSGGGGDMGGALAGLAAQAGMSQEKVQEALQMALMRKIDPDAAIVKERPYREKRRFPLGFQPVTVAPGDVATTVAEPQDLFRAERLFVPSSIAFGFRIVDLKVGTESQLVSQGEIPAAVFTEVSVDSYIRFRTAIVGNEVSITVRNTTGQPVEFEGALIGTAAR